MSTVTKELAIEGMACSGCSDAVQKALSNIDNVQSADADHEHDTATVTCDSDEVSADAFKQAVDEAGYEFMGIKN